MTLPKLSLRDLFAVVTIVALLLGWWVDRSRLVDSLMSRDARIEALQTDMDVMKSFVEQQHELQKRDWDKADEVWRQSELARWRAWQREIDSRDQASHSK
jgi:hypothetical protein